MDDLPKLDDLPPLGFTERELFSIYLKYSETDFDVETIENNAARARIEQEGQSTAPGNHPSPEQKASESVDSSPASHNDCDYDSSQMTCSSTHTTPLKHLMMRGEPRSRTEYTQFLADLEVSDLPPDGVTYLKSLASQMVEMGGHLQHYQDQEDKGDAEDVIVEEAGQLMQLLESSTKKCSDQVANTDWVKELGVFTLVPTDVALWSNYRQRVDLITRHLAVPSTAEYRLLEGLVRVYDAYTHYPFIQLTGTKVPTTTSTYPELIRNVVADLSTTVHSLLTAYKHWLQTSYRFRTAFMVPLMRRIQDSPWVRREIEQSEATIDMACLSLHKRYESGEMKQILHEDQLRGAEMLAERRSKSSVLPGQLGGRTGLRAGGGEGKGRTRVRREHTM